MNSCFPFFLGSARSGTTLLRALFDSHPDMAVPPESNFVSSMGAERTRYESDDGLAVARFVDELFDTHGWGIQKWSLSPSDVMEVLTSEQPRTVPAAIRAIYQQYAEKQGKTRYGDKTTHYISVIPQLADLLPESRFVHIVRDGRDVTLALLDSPWGFNTVPHIAVYWATCVEAGRRAGRWLGEERYCELRYEDLVATPDETLRKICDFVDLKFNDAMLAYFTRADEIIAQTESPEHHQRLALPITKGLRDWTTQMSGTDVDTFQLIAGDLLADLQYPISQVTPRR